MVEERHIIKKMWLNFEKFPKCQKKLRNFQKSDVKCQVTFKNKMVKGIT